MLGIHQDGEIVACQKTRKRDRKIVGTDMGFFVSSDRIQKMFDQKEIKKMPSVI